MNVELIAYTPDPERIVASAAKLCYSSSGVCEIKENLSNESTEKFIKNLLAMGHTSPIEHVSFTFAIEGISRVLSHQLVRHRLASYSQQSQRYVALNQFEYIIPPSIEKNEKAKMIFEQTMESDQKAYDDLVNILKPRLYDEEIKSGKTEKAAVREAEKRAIEDARFVFPNACETKIVVTMNARSLYNFFEHRCCNRAQWEIRALAFDMLKLVKEVAPTLFSNAGPACVDGGCPEGKMSCGKMNEVREIVSKMSLGR